jgi:hypothetical protein
MPVVAWAYCVATESVSIYGRFAIGVVRNIVDYWGEVYASTIEPPLDHVCQSAIGKDCV